MNAPSDQAIYVYKIPLWGKSLYFGVLLVICYALLTRMSQLKDLWELRLLGKFLLLFAGGSLVFFAYALFRFRTVFTKQLIYQRTWRGTKIVPYSDIIEMHYSRSGSVFFILKNSSQLEAWICPSKLDAVLSAVASAGCSPVNRLDH